MFRPGSTLAAALLAGVAVWPAGAAPQAAPVFPDADWREESPDSQGVDGEKLRAAIAYMQSTFGPDGAGELAIVRNGRLIYKGTGADTYHNVWSCTKTFTSTVLGLLIGDGKCALDDPAVSLLPAADRRYSAYAGIRLRHLASMSAGYKGQVTGVTKEREWGDPMFYLNPVTPLFEAGTKVQYNDHEVMLLGRILTGLAGESLKSLFGRRIAGPIGFQPWDWGSVGSIDGIELSNAPGNPARPGIQTTARQMARFGYLYLNGGNWKGKQLLPASFVAEAVRNQAPGVGQSAFLHGRYGFYWWTNDIMPGGKRPWPSAPPSTYTSHGHSANFCFIVPEWRMVIVRMGTAAIGPLARQDAMWDGFFARIAGALQGNGGSATAEALYFPPPGEGMEAQSRRTPAEAGFDPNVVKALEGSATRWALWRHGRLIHVHGDFNRTEDVASHRKTWHAMTVGAALQQKRIPSLDQPIGVWNPELTGRHARATWRHVITQAAGFDYPYAGHPAYDPGEMWTYSDYNPVHLCNALARVYGRKDYRDGYDTVARAAYFDAIGMRGWRTVIRKDPRFSADDDGVRFQFDLEDMGRLGLLALARGAWDGKQLVPEWFVKLLETKQTRGMRVNYQGPNDGTLSFLTPAKFPEAPYGFMTWVNTDGDYYPGADRGWAAAHGGGRSYTLWNQKFGIVFAAFGGGNGPLVAPTSQGVPHILESHLRK